jgi:hypothetical protein
MPCRGELAEAGGLALLPTLCLAATGCTITEGSDSLLKASCMVTKALEAPRR